MIVPAASAPADVTPAILEPWLERDEAILVDVREADEAFRAGAPSCRTCYHEFPIFWVCRPVKGGVLQVTIGQLEKIGLRIADLEIRLGRRPSFVGRRWKEPARREPKLTEADIWFRDRLQDGHLERLTKVEEDTVGAALEAFEQGDVPGAQALLDALETEHRLRMELERGNCAGADGEN